jgi:hypothetical protein
VSHRAVSWALAQRGLRPATKMVLIVLADRANGQGQCWPSRETIAEEAGVVSLNTVDDHLQVLVDVGLVIKEQRKTAAGRPTSFMFTLNLDLELLDKHLQRNRKILRPPIGEGCNSCTPAEEGQTAYLDVQKVDTNNSGAKTAQEPSTMNQEPPQPPSGERGVLDLDPRKENQLDLLQSETDERVKRFLGGYPTDPSDRVAGERAFRKLSAGDQEAALRWCGTYLADCRSKSRKVKSPQTYIRDRVFEGYAATGGGAQATVANGSRRTWTRKGSPQWQRWAEYRGQLGIPERYDKDRREWGWDLPSEWPPGQQPRADEARHEAGAAA